MNMIKSLVMCLFLLISTPSMAADAVEIEIVEYGIYTSEIVGTIPAPLTTSGRYNLVKNVNLVAGTDNIPASKGTKFGLFYIVHGDSPGEEVIITEIVKFPPPGYRDSTTGKIFRRSEFSSTKKIESKNFVAGVFAEDWDLFPGEWIIQLWHQNQKLAEKKFTVYKASSKSSASPKE